MDHLLWCMSKSLASKPAIVPTMTSHVQLQPLTQISLQWYNWIKGAAARISHIIFVSFTEPSRWHLCFTSEYCTCHPLSLLWVKPPVVWEKCSQLSVPLSWLYKNLKTPKYHWHFLLFRSVLQHQLNLLAYGVIIILGLLGFFNVNNSSVCKKFFAIVTHCKGNHLPLVGCPYGYRFRILI